MVIILKMKLTQAVLLSAAVGIAQAKLIGAPRATIKAVEKPVADAIESVEMDPVADFIPEIEAPEEVQEVPEAVQDDVTEVKVEPETVEVPEKTKKEEHHANIADVVKPVIDYAIQKQQEEERRKAEEERLRIEAEERARAEEAARI